MNSAYRRISSSIRCNFQPIAWAKEKIYNISSLIEKVSGFKEVRIAQEKVNEASRKLAALQNQRSEALEKVKQVQVQLKQICVELGKTKRGEDEYVTLIVQENKLLKMERLLQVAYEEVELKEKEQFTALVLAVNNSHEKERLHMRMSQYWSIIGSLCSALLGIIGTLLTSYVRYNKLSELIIKSSTEGKEKIHDKTGCKRNNKQDRGVKMESNVTYSPKVGLNNVDNNVKQLTDSVNNLNVKVTPENMEPSNSELFIGVLLLIFVLGALKTICFGNN